MHPVTPEPWFSLTCSLSYPCQIPRPSRQWCPEGQSEKAGVWVLIPHTPAWTLWDRYVNSQERSYFDLMYNEETGSFSEGAWSLEGTSLKQGVPGKAVLNSLPLLGTGLYTALHSVLSVTHLPPSQAFPSLL